MANIIRLGSLYLCGNPVSVEDDYLSRPNWSIEIGETVPGKEISWVAVNGIFIADRCILRDISWNNLLRGDSLRPGRRDVQRLRQPARQWPHRH